MRTSIYDALEIATNSSAENIRVAVRTVVRRFWAVPRDASGDSEEAVRFAALAASMLLDRTRRKDYDVALNPGVGSGPWRLPVGGAGLRDMPLSEGGTDSRVLGEGAEVSQLSIVATAPKALPGVDALAEPLPEGAAWQSPLVWGGFAFATLLLWYALTQWFSGAMTYRLLVGLGGAALLAAASVFAALWASRVRAVPQAAASLSRLAIIKWRRESSIFIGAPAPQHDTAWVFKLRLMELTRSAAGFVTATNAWRRFAARVVDYSIVGLLVFGVIQLGDVVLPWPDAWFAWMRSPLLLPVLTVLAAVPAEALLLRTIRTTPGKWLLGMVVVVGVTRPADHAAPSQAQLCCRRAWQAAWRGAALGVWPLALVWLPGQLERARRRENDWEVGGDSLVMARPLARSGVATAVAVVLAAVLTVGAAWRSDGQTWWPALRASVGSMSALMTDLMPRRSAPVQAPPVAGDEPVAPGGGAPVAPVTTGAPAAPPDTPRGTVQPVPAVAPAASPTADDEMTRQARASQARRARVEGYAKQAEAARRSGNYGALMGACQQWTQDQPGNAEAWRCYGLAQFQNGRGRDALPALRQALKLEPNDRQVEAAILAILRP